MRTIQILALIVLILSTTPVTIAQTHGGSTQITGASSLHGVCGDEAKGWLLVVGKDTNNHGVVYNVTNLNSPSLLLSINPNDFKIPQYNVLTLYACTITKHDSDIYLLWLAGTLTTVGGQQSRGIVLVYMIPGTGGTPTQLGYRVSTDITALVSVRDLVVVRNSSNSNVYHIYGLSVLGTTVSLVRTNATVRIGGTPSASFTSFSRADLGSGDGYGITYNPAFNRFGVLWKSDNNLYLRVYDNVNAGNPTQVTQITITSNFDGIRAAEAAYSQGCLIAAGGKIYKLDGSTLSVSVLIDNAFSGDAYAMLISERDGRSAAYLYAVSNNALTIHAYDLLKPGTAYIDTIASGLSMSGYGDAFVAYADPSTKAVKPAGTGNPYMVYTAGNAIIYYDLTRGGSVPYPIPEPSILLVIAVVAAAFLVIYKIASKIIY